MSFSCSPPGKRLLLAATAILCISLILPVFAQEGEEPESPGIETTATIESAVGDLGEPAETGVTESSSSSSETPSAIAHPVTQPDGDSESVPSDVSQDVIPEAAMAIDGQEPSLSTETSSEEPESVEVPADVPEPITETTSAVDTAESASELPGSNEPATADTSAASTSETAEAKETAPAAVPAPAVQSSTESPQADVQYFDRKKFSVLVIILALLSFVTYFTLKARRGEDMFIRRISGLSALEDAVGRATEMGRGVLYIPGIMDMDDIQTIAGITILGHVAKKTAEYDTPLYAPMTRSFTMSVAQEVVKQAYLEKGRPNDYRADRIHYLTDDQFGFVAGVGGIMMREKPAACFYLGTFYAESLILAETGHAVGAIQIAGTAEPSQIPFFVAACDYTLIGEELFAASAYLSRNPKEVGSLKGQDIGKVLIIFAIVIGTILISVAQSDIAHSYPAWKSVAQYYLDILN